MKQAFLAIVLFEIICFICVGCNSPNLSFKGSIDFEQDGESEKVEIELEEKI
jgi:hypothetical protein